MQIFLYKLYLCRLLCLIISYPPTLSKLSWVNFHKVIDCLLISNLNILPDCDNHNWWINQRKLRAFMSVIWVENRNPSNALEELLGYCLVTFQVPLKLVLFMERKFKGFSHLVNRHWAILFLYYYFLVLDTQWHDTNSNFSELIWHNLSFEISFYLQIIKISRVKAFHVGSYVVFLWGQYWGQIWRSLEILRMLIKCVLK